MCVCEYEYNDDDGDDGGGGDGWWWMMAMYVLCTSANSLCVVLC